MADAEDLKSSGDFSSCGFDSHPGHHFPLSVQSVAPYYFFSFACFNFGVSAVVPRVVPTRAPVVPT